MYKDFLLAVIVFHRMLSNGFHSTEEIFFAFSKFCISTNLIYMFKKIYGLLQISEVNQTVEFCNTILEAHMRTASFSSHPCTCGHVRKSSQVSAIEVKESTPDNLEFFTRTNPSNPKLIHTYARCSACAYELSGEEIVAGWFASMKGNDASSVFFSGDTKCPCCGVNVGPELKILHEGELGKEIWSTVPMIRPTMMKNLLMKELKFLSTGSSLLFNIRLNTSLFWNLVWWFSMVNLPSQSTLGLINHLSDRKPVKFRMPVLEPWSLLFGVRAANSPEEVPTVSQDIATNLPHSLCKAILGHIRDAKVGLASNEFMEARKANPTSLVFERSLFKTLAVINKDNKVIDITSFSRNFAAELLSEDFQEKDQLQKKDQLLDPAIADRICEFSELLHGARERFTHDSEPAFISTLYGLYLDMSFDPEKLMESEQPSTKTPEINGVNNIGQSSSSVKDKNSFLGFDDSKEGLLTPQRRSEALIIDSSNDK
eukprot:TRINITY_DN19177_c0_g2_i1.p1 TRINITY_DN19177_c0_g2~~TRINITY_DN19177_c0_g2_i1.p1  ORF type:complete len:549 (+),score=116.63 TRINITY_DN19177_c0_g2_i1:198-1649(+)